MAHFYRFERADIRVTGRHVGIRRFALFRYLPHWVGSKPEFVLRSVTGKQILDKTLPVYEWWPGMKGESQVRSIGPFKVPGEVKEWPIKGFHIPADGALEFWIHQPKMVGSSKVADFKGNWKDQIWLMVLSAIVGFLVGAFGQALINVVATLKIE